MTTTITSIGYRSFGDQSFPPPGAPQVIPLLPYMWPATSYIPPKSFSTLNRENNTTSAQFHHPRTIQGQNFETMESSVSSFTFEDLMMKVNLLLNTANNQNLGTLTQQQPMGQSSPNPVSLGPTGSQNLNFPSTLHQGHLPQIIPENRLFRNKDQQHEIPSATAQQDPAAQRQGIKNSLRVSASFSTDSPPLPKTEPYLSPQIKELAKLNLAYSAPPKLITGNHQSLSFTHRFEILTLSDIFFTPIMHQRVLHEFQTMYSVLILLICIIECSFVRQLFDNG